MPLAMNPTMPSLTTPGVPPPCRSWVNFLVTPRYTLRPPIAMMPRPMATTRIRPAGTDISLADIVFSPEPPEDPAADRESEGGRRRARRRQRRALPSRSVDGPLAALLRVPVSPTRFRDLPHHQREHADDGEPQHDDADRIVGQLSDRSRLRGLVAAAGPGELQRDPGDQQVHDAVGDQADLHQCGAGLPVGGAFDAALGALDGTGRLLVHIGHEIRVPGPPIGANGGRCPGVERRRGRVRLRG